MKEIHRIFFLIATIFPLLLAGALASGEVPSGTMAADIAKLRPPDVQLNNIEIMSFSLDGAILAIKLAVNNPNAEDIVVETINYQVILNGTEVKRGSLNNPPVLPGLETRDISVKVLLGYDSALPAVLDALNNPASATYEISGHIKIAGEQDALYFSHKDKLVFPSTAENKIRGLN